MQRPSRAWLFEPPSAHLPLVDASVSRQYLADEAQTVRSLLKRARLPARGSREVVQAAGQLVEAMRRNRRHLGGLDAFMIEYDLSSSEGIVLMCLAEALLRIPDAETADRLIADKLSDADWEAHLGTSESLLVNAGTWALMLTGLLLQDEELAGARLGGSLSHMVGRLGEPVIRTALRQGMRILGHQFVMGRTIEEALERSGGSQSLYRYSFDMLGEAALTAADARRYLESYAGAIPVIGASVEAGVDLMDAPSISVKLSALSPRFEFAQSARALTELAHALRELALLAKEAGIALTVDAEETDRLELSMAVFEAVLKTPQLKSWPGLGLVVQTYQKRAWDVVIWLEALARSEQRTIPVRLVKGAYWDTEIKRAQEQGLAGYPVFTRKSSTDAAYLACAGRLLAASPTLYPQFATHNAHAVAWILHEGSETRYEFQRLHGMGEELYTEIVGPEKPGRACRVYAPVGSHEDLLPYLVRRLLENGANTSFVNRFVSEDADIEEIVADPVPITDALEPHLSHPNIPLPEDLFGAARRNSRGVNLADFSELSALAEGLAAVSTDWKMAPLVDGETTDGTAIPSIDPFRPQESVGTVKFASAETAERALAVASGYQGTWNDTPAADRAAILSLAGERFEAHASELVALIVREAGRTVRDALSEIRETVDFLRYYAAESERLFAEPVSLAGPTGERNELRLQGRGVFLTISPWNFPLSIFTGQTAAALAAGNTVLAKPAEQTPLIAGRAVELLMEAGVPAGALHYLPGGGAALGGVLVPDPRVAGIAFTGSTETAQIINRTLAQRDGPLGTLIAETGGVNAMIVDSSALTEQVVRDVAQSAFDSAGQRCSALRLLCLQTDTADDVLAMLKGYMEELVIGDPGLLSTDVGPVIDLEARQMLMDYLSEQRGRIFHQCELKTEHQGLFVPPTVLELEAASDLRHEVFGPVLHVVRYPPDEVDDLVDAINTVGFGLTLGIHSRVDALAERIARRARVGNVYVNRNMIGAQVGVQPFGGMGLSGTGPKAGGPHYLPRFAAEQTVTVNTAAVGGNATLLSLGADE